MDTQILEDVGLSNTEVKVFMALLELGESKAGSIITNTKLQSSSVYNAINGLIKKGLLSYIKKSNIKYYKAANPETILDYIDTKKKEFEKILPELKIKQMNQEEEGVEFYKSYKGIRTMLRDLLIDAKPNDVYRYYSIEDPKKYDFVREKVYSVQKLQRVTKQLKSKAIFPESFRKIVPMSKTSEKRFLDMPLPPNSQMINNKIAIISWDDEPSGILIKSKSIYEQYTKFFDSLWKMGNK
ncbi:hypothetical protein KY334_03320 [Candidatus Woesearchaeota archaeon]|nr:hypothetical protein [Candidatus Woesearchaeota archaeon]